MTNSRVCRGLFALSCLVVAILWTFLMWSPCSVAAAARWNRPDLRDPIDVQLSGTLGDCLNRGLGRIALPPYSAAFVLADVSFSTNRWFTNYSGDISGRYLELASVTSTRDNPQPAALPSVLEQIAAFQKPDGHFGGGINWTNTSELHGPAWDSKVMPLFWGNGRLLLGLTAASRRFQKPQMLAAARRLGDFYATVGLDVFCDPARTNEYNQASAYAGAYVTCYFEGMEGLVQLYRLTADKRYLNTAVRMADFHEQFDTLPVGHSHGSLSQHEALVMLYEETANPKYIHRVAARWKAAVNGGYVSPAGGVLEKFVVTGYNRDEGCSEADWLRVCLMLWRNTGRTEYLDMAERTVWNEYFANQWADGGYGHRTLGVDNLGPFAFHEYSEEALWCCSFHGPLALNDFKSYLAVGSPDGIFFNFPADFVAPVSTSRANWLVRSRTLKEGENVPIRCEIQLDRKTGSSETPLFIRQPDWAEKLDIQVDGRPVAAAPMAGYVKTGPLPPGSKVRVEYHAHPFLETRRFKKVDLAKTGPPRVEQAVIRYGPNVLISRTSGDITELELKLEGGFLQLPSDQEKLTSWPQLLNSSKRHAFVFNVMVTDK